MHHGASPYCGNRLEHAMQIRARSIHFISVIALAGGAVLLSAGCDNPVEGDGHDHAEDVVGAVLSTPAGEVARSEGGLSDDTLWVPLGGTTDTITIEFLAGDGDEVHVEDLQEDFELGWTVGDADIVGFDQQGDWSFTLEGLTADTTTLSIQLLHLPQRHNDFTTADIDVVVR